MTGGSASHSLPPSSSTFAFAFEKCKCVTAWAGLTIDNFQVDVVSGGLTNKLFRCRNLLISDEASTPDSPASVLLRLYGEASSAMFNREKEVQVFCILSEMHIGVKIYGIFPECRVEEYLPSRCLLTKELSIPNLSIYIGYQLAFFHSVYIPSLEPAGADSIIQSEMNTPSPLARDAVIPLVHRSSITQEPASMFATMYRWLSQVAMLHPTPSFVNACPPAERPRAASSFECGCDVPQSSVSSSDEINCLPLPEGMTQAQKVCWVLQNTPFTLEFLQNEISELEMILPLNRSRVVFCHNDLQEGNILLLSDGSARLRFIDFEYSTYNYRGFDFGNHFCEWGINYTNPEFPGFWTNPEDYPSVFEKRRFFYAYLLGTRKVRKIMAERSRALEDRLAEVRELIREEITGEIDVAAASESNELSPYSAVDPNFWDTLDEDMKQEIDLLVDEGTRFMLASHLSWSIWSYLQASVSSIDFGYMEYAVARLQDYLRIKKQLGPLRTSFSS